MPGYSKFMKDLVLKKRTLSYEDIGGLHQFNAITFSSLMQKKGDPSAFTIP